MTRAAYLTVLSLTMMSLTACANGGIVPERQRINPSSDFLYCLADEYEGNIHGECTKEVIKDWVAINEY